MEARKLIVIKRIGNLKELIGEQKILLKQAMNLRESLFYAVKRGLPDSAEDVTGNYLSGNYGHHIGKSLVQYAQDLEIVQGKIDQLSNFITICESDIEKLMKQVS
ncbi:hypothetical protein [Terribacillus saccharophilus]|uniref:hypothetical protein n=1 Tax=Terribacillus saccharophilus TaxID=361277 RepID=UPI000C9AC268|nr:hypothetical protein [Terribacillus goriensis]